jgi:hypothetical protein
MAVESLGGVSVTIDGDLGPLKTAFTQAQASAQQAGAGVAAAFTAGSKTIAGAQAAVKQATENLAQAQKLFAQATAAAAGDAAFAITAGNKEVAASIALVVEQYKAELVAATAALAGMAGATAEAGNAEVALAAKTEVATVALKHQVSELQAVSGLLRVGEGAGAFRAAEKALTLIPGLGALAQMIFPVVGAIALAEAFYKIWEKTDPLIKAQADLVEVTKKTNQEFESLSKTFDRINVAQLTAEFSKAAGLHLAAFYSQTTADEDKDRINALVAKIEWARGRIKAETTQTTNPIISTLEAFNPLITGMKFAEGRDAAAQAVNIEGFQKEIELLKYKGTLAEKQAKLDATNSAKDAARDSAQIAIASIANQIAATTRLSDSIKQKYEIEIRLSQIARDAEIAAMHDPHARAIAQADDDVRVAQDRLAKLKPLYEADAKAKAASILKQTAQEKVGKDPGERAALEIRAQGQIVAANDEAAKLITALWAAEAESEARTGVVRVTQQREVMAQWDAEVMKGFESLDKQWKQALARGEKYTQDQLNQLTRVAEIDAKGKGSTDALTIQANKLAAERAYGDAALHTAAQQVEYARQLAGFDSQARAAKIAGLAAELVIAQAAATEISGGEKVANIQQQINALKLEGANADEAAAIKNEQALERLTLHYKLQAALRNAGQQIPGAIGGALASGLTGGQRGESVGQQITTALRGVGQQLLSTAFTALINQLVVTTGVQALLGSITGTSTATHVAATTVNTAALAANTAALAAHGAVGAAGGVVGAAGGLGGAAGSVASTAAGGLVGPLIAAAGGVIGGVISGVMGLIGSASIVKAVHGTTAAVQALRTVPGGAPGTAAGGLATAPPPAPSGGGLFDDIPGKISSGLLEGLFGLGASNAIPVRVVSGYGIAGKLAGGLFGSLLGLIGFAGGGSPPIGVPSWIGEHGKELWIPHEAGVIVPNNQLGNMPMPRIGGSSSSSVSNSSGDQHFTFHVNGAANTRETVRAIADYMKSASPAFATASSRSRL